MTQTTTTQNGWRETTLGEVADISAGGDKPKHATKKADSVHTIPIFSNGITDDGLYGFTDTPKILEPSITVSARGTIGYVALRLEPYVPIVRLIVVIPNVEKADLRYLYFYLKSKNISGTGSTQEQLTVPEFKNFPVSLPTLPEQRAIAGVLSSLDDKIELLREQNKTLEETAQTIFKEWFGKYKACNELPAGWRVGKLGEELKISIGRTPPRGETQWFSNTPTGKKWISIKDIGNSGTYIFNTSEYLTDKAIEKFNIPVIPKNTTVLSFKMTVGKLTITTEEMLSNEAIAHLKIKKDSGLTSEFIYCCLQNLDFNSLGSTSSIVTAINSTMIKQIEIIIPCLNILEKFNRVLKPLFEKILNNSSQIQTISTLRDTLLPRLMRGDLRVKI